MSAGYPQVRSPSVIPVTCEPGDACPVREILDRVGDKWSVLVVGLLGLRTHRFSELHRSIEGISQRMLTLTLRTLERDGLITRTVYPTVPPRVEYALTDLGRTLLEHVTGLERWARTHRADILAARTRYDSPTDEGQDSPGRGGFQRSSQR